jgi:phospholipase C
LLSPGVDSTLYDHTSVLKTLEKLFGLSSLTQRDANANDLTSLLSSNAVADVKTLMPPKPAVAAAVAARPARTAEEQAQIDAQPLPDRGNLHGAVMIASKADYELSPQTAADLAAIKAKVAAIRTRGDAHAYIASVMEKVRAAKAAKKPTSPPPPAQ